VQAALRTLTSALACLLPGYGGDTGYSCSRRAERGLVIRKKSTRYFLVASTFVGVVQICGSAGVTANAAVSPPHSIKWLAAGDSYAAGQGLSRTTKPCARGTGQNGLGTTWSISASRDLQAKGLSTAGGNPDLVACTGAISADFFTDNNAALGGNKHSAQWTPKMGRFDLVTFSFGGDDVGFSSVISHCEKFGCPSDADERAKIALLGTTGAYDKGVHIPPYATFLRHVANASVVHGGNIAVVGYPEIVEDASRWSPGRTTCGGMSSGEVQRVRGWAGDLNSTIGSAVSKVDALPPSQRNDVYITFVDPVNGENVDGIGSADSNLFEPASGARHELCSQGGQVWMNGLIKSHYTRSFHPNQAGENSMGALVADVINTFNWPWSTSPAPSGLNGHGLLSIDCHTNADSTMDLTDPTTGKNLVTQTLPAPRVLGSLGQVSAGFCNQLYGNQAPFSGEYNGVGDNGAVANLSIRERFDRTFSEVVFASQTQPDGSEHVGYLSIDSKSNVFTDVTSATSGSGFGSTPPVDSSPVFDPISDDFYFLRNTNTSSTPSDEYDYQVWKFDPQSKKGESIGTLQAGSGGFDITIQGGFVVVGDYLLSPDGTEFADPGIGDVAYFPASAGGTIVDSDPLQSFDSVGAPTKIGPEAYMENYQNAGIEAYGWVGNSAVACSMGINSTDIFSVPVVLVAPQPGSVLPSVNPADMLPSNSAINSNAVVSPDGSMMAFLSTQGSVAKVYVVGTSGGAPRQLASESLGVMVAWQ
jgi:hypothetical protein